MTRLQNSVGSKKTGIIDRSSPIPLYYQLAQKLEEEIVLGKYKPNDKFPTDMELSEKFDVSRITVRQALSELISKGLLVRERGRGTFVRPGIKLPREESKVIKYHRLGLVMPWGLGTFFAPLLDAIEDVAHNQGFHVILANNREDPEVEIARVRELLNHGVDGILWMCPSKGSNYALVRKMLRAVPVVVAIDRIPDLPNLDVNLVEADNYDGMKKMVKYLIEKGRKKIAFIRELLSVNPIDERIRGYQDGLREEGIEFSSDWIFTSRKFFRENGELCAQKILKSSEQFDAICCTTDDTAIGAIHTLRRAGVRVPEDIAVAGFNDDPTALAVRPQLTTVRQDVKVIGKRAIELLLQQLELLERGESIVTTRIKVPVELVVRESA